MNSRIVIATILILVTMSGMAVAETGEIPVNGIEEDWVLGMRNFVPNNISGVIYDFEEGSNCEMPFKNQYPDIAMFLTVLGTRPYGADEPSYAKIGGRMCGNTRSEMFIYPHPNTYYNGTPKPWVYIVNGDVGFTSITGPDTMGGYWPGTKARIQFREDTHYISFLASTGGNLVVRLYDAKGKKYNLVYSKTIPVTIHRNGTEPSTFTKFSVYLPNVDIARMDVYGGFNAWIIDDLVVGGEPGYIYERRDYGWAAERMKTLIGAQYHELGLGYDIITGTFLTAEEIMDGIDDPIWNPIEKSLEWGEGICPEALLIWAFNNDENLVNNLYLNDQRERDFTEDISYEDVQPGDVYFIDYPPADSYIDEAGMFVEPYTDQATGYVYDIIRVLPDEGVCYDSSGWIEDMHNENPTAIVDYRSLPDNPKGTKSPYPKHTGKPI